MSVTSHPAATGSRLRNRRGEGAKLRTDILDAAAAVEQAAVTEAEISELGQEAIGVFAAALADGVAAGASTSTDPGPKRSRCGWVCTGWPSSARKASGFRGRPTSPTG